MPEGREILIECVQIGTALRVTAIDAETGREVVFQAPASSSRMAIQKLAADKMRFVLNKAQTDE